MSQIRISSRSALLVVALVCLLVPVGRPVAGIAATSVGESCVLIDADVSKLADQPIRLKFFLRDADLFAFRFQP